MSSSHSSSPEYRFDPAPAFPARIGIFVGCLVLAASLAAGIAGGFFSTYQAIVWLST